MRYTILLDGGEHYILNYPAGNNGGAVNIRTALTADGCERVLKQARGRACFEVEL